MHFTWKERQEGKNKTIASDNSTIIHHYSPHHVEEDMTAHPRR
jgi:hypothetical protein